MEAFDGSLSADGAQKAAEFVTFCDAFHIPVLTITNVEGFAASDYDEKHLAKAAAKLTYAFANAHGAQGKCDHPESVRFRLCGDEQQVCGSGYGLCMEGIPDRYDGRLPGCKDHVCRRGYGSDKRKGFRIRQTAGTVRYLAASRGYVDTIIEPADTRKYVIGAFEMLFTKREERPAKMHGTV